jgi:DNA (cytosine-5)-methyltransferase 1
MYEPKILSLFSGVGGFDMGLEAAGMETVFQCEHDKYAVNILEKHWPHIPRWSDVNTLTGRHILDHVPIVDVVAWGSPCQDLSSAGRRAGLTGERSSLFHQGIRIIKEIRKETNGKYPKISIWENVVGALSSNKGADFGYVLDKMAEAGALVVEWRILDAQYFGVPQRRRRVFVVAVFDPATAERCPDPLLDFPQSLPGDNKESSESIKKTAHDSGKRTEDSRIKDRSNIKTFAQIGFSQYTEGAGCLRASGGDLGGGTETLIVSKDPYSNYNSVVGPLAASDWKFPQQQQVYEGKVIIGEQIENNKAVSISGNITHPLTSSMHSSEDGYGRGTPIVAISEEKNIILRKLTPLECERLMGWPDNWTAGSSDTQRYKQCGNGVASPVAHWIGSIVVNLINGRKM